MELFKYLYFSSSVDLILYLAVRLKADVRLGLVLIHKRMKQQWWRTEAPPLPSNSRTIAMQTSRSRDSPRTPIHTREKQIKQNAEVSLVSLYFCSKYTKQTKKTRKHILNRFRYGFNPKLRREPKKLEIFQASNLVLNYFQHQR